MLIQANRMTFPITITIGIIIMTASSLTYCFSRDFTCKSHHWTKPRNIGIYEFNNFEKVPPKVQHFDFKGSKKKPKHLHFGFFRYI